MTKTQILRTTAIIGIIGSILSFGVTIIRVFDVKDDIPLLFAYLDSLSITLLLVGLVMSYLRYYNELGKFGFVAFGVSFIGFVWLNCMIWMYGFAGPVIKELDPSAYAGDTLPYPLSSGIATSGMILTLGLVLYGLSLAISKKGSRLTGVLLILGGIAFPIGSKIEFVNLIAATLVTLGILWVSIKIWNEKPSSAQTGG